MDIIYYILNTCSPPPRSAFVMSKFWTVIPELDSIYMALEDYSCPWNAKCPIFLGNFTPKTSNYCLKNRALGFPGPFKKWVPKFQGIFFSCIFGAGIWVYNPRHLAGIWLRGRQRVHMPHDKTWPHMVSKKHIRLFTCFWGCWWHVDLLISRILILFDSWNKYINQEHLAMFLNLLGCLFFGLEFQIGSSTSDSLLITVSKGNNFHPPKYVCQTDWCSSQYVGRWIRMLRRQLPALREMWHAHQCDYLSRKFVRSQYLGHLPKMFLYLPFLQRFNHCTFDLTALIKMANCCKVTW